jgi:integrase
MSTRDRGDGGYRRRGDAWTLRFSATDPKTGQRVRRYATFKGSETAARAKLRELLKQSDDGKYATPTRRRFGDVLDTWESGLNVSPKTAERYRELVKLHIRPHLGAIQLRSLVKSRLESFYADLRDGRTPEGQLGGRRLSARTVGHIHRLVVQALAVAEDDNLIPSNPARTAKRPKIEHGEIEILSEAEVRDVLCKLQGREPMRRMAALGLSTGMRRGEICALRWKDVELEKASLRVEQSLEQTKAGLRFKSPKTRYSARPISLPPSIVSELRALRKEQLVQQEQRLKLGLGREPDDALVFRRIDPKTGAIAPLLPNSVTTEWRRLVVSLKLPKVSLHAWRHTHASQLIDSGMDVLTISRRLGHGSPAITLSVYGHRFSRKDEGAADVFEAAFAGTFARTDADETSTAKTADGVRMVSEPIRLRKVSPSST